MRFVILAAAAAAIATPAMAEPFAGPYVGAEVGVDNYEVKEAGIDGLSANGIVGGVYAGYDVALGANAFAGIEANASLSGAKATYDDGVDVARIKARESYGATARLGYMLNDSTALYGRAGWANTKFKASVNGVSAGSDSDDALVLGAGVETRIGSKASLRVEYTRVDYSDLVKNNQVRAGVGYRF